MIKTVILLLHTAATHCHVNCVNILLNAGTHVNKLKEPNTYLSKLRSQ